jgi:hypothetical protein
MILPAIGIGVAIGMVVTVVGRAFAIWGHQEQETTAIRRELPRVVKEESQAVAAASHQELWQMLKRQNRRAFWLSIAAGLPLGIATSIVASYVWTLVTGH